MHENGIRAQLKSRYKPQTTQADANKRALPNLLQQQFAVGMSNRVWLADITYTRVNGTWHYLAAVLAMGTRKIVGWSVGTRPDQELALAALNQAIEQEKPAMGLIHHSDRGCQYTSNGYQALLTAHKLVGSMSRKGNPYDNAPMESFFRTLKAEFLYKNQFSSLEQLRNGVREWIRYYNCNRLHSALGYKSPLDYETSHITPFNMSA